MSTGHSREVRKSLSELYKVLGEGDTPAGAPMDSRPEMMMQSSRRC